MKTRNHGIALLMAYLLLLLAFLALAGCSSPLSNMATITPIYAATSGGLSVYTGSGWTTYTTSSGVGLPSDTVNDVVVSGSGATAFIYAATNSGIWFYNSSNPPTIANSQYLSSQIKADFGLASTPTISGLFVGSRIFAATSAGLLEVGSSGKVFLTTSDGLASNSVNGVYEDASGNIYVATANGLSICAGGKWQTCTTANGLASNTINAVFVDAYGSIYAATGAKLSLSDDAGSTWTPYAFASSSDINSVFVDLSEKVYLGTAADGLIYWNRLTGYYYIRTVANSGLASDTVNRVFVSDGVIYAATAAGLSVSSDYGASWKNYKASNGLGSDTVNSIVATAPLYSY